jgi:hypothetical protein
MEAFPEAADEIIPRNIKILEEESAESLRELRSELANIKTIQDPFSRWFWDEVFRKITMPNSLFFRNQQKITHLKRLMLWASGKNNKKNKHFQNFQINLENARNYPIYEIVSQYIDLKPIGDKFVGLCPFHNEKTPSFYIYPETNTFHCFGCQEHGDVIKLTMALSGVDFKNAVSMLQN